MATLDLHVSRYLVERVRRRELLTLTARNQEAPLRGFARSFGDRPLSRIGQRDVERWLETLEHRAPTTRRSYFSVVRNFCAWLLRRKLVRHDPTVEMKSPRTPRTLPRALALSVVITVMSALPDARSVLIVTLMVQEGLRCCEVAGLELGDLDLANGTMRVVGKGGHQRMLPITDESRRAMAAYLAEHPASTGPLIRSYRDAYAPLSPRTISAYVSDWLDELGLKSGPRDGVSAHAFRHTAATDMLRNGAHIRDVQMALGHSSLSSTERYLPWIVKGLAAAMGGRTYTAADAVADVADVFRAAAD